MVESRLDYVRCVLSYALGKNSIQIHYKVTFSRHNHNRALTYAEHSDNCRYSSSSAHDLHRASHAAIDCDTDGM